ncbi:nicotinamide riboside transporter PnuC [Marinoscillum sp. 108]|uniref:nicotinamide riboside transporter PnuC n=1 Tax=Marinoscillum sp. 108 TaxID=2653151 RepID=UPI0012F0037D|nr:nicotinamide riboside transporter PnuC [Marinoscillum sp. 108]VXD19143.1 Nicotinamide mononucleotide transporter [Marinoscillum sp. 108]
MNEFFSQLLEQMYQTTWLEAVAVFFGLLSVWYSKQENILVYPTGIVSVLIYIYLTLEYKLYADMGINGYYFVMSVYGWYHWTDSENKPQIPITSNSKKQNVISILFFIVSFIVIRTVLVYFTDSDVPNWDSITSSFALVGMWLMAEKKIENWIAWIIADIISVPLYLYKGLPFTAFQFFVFTVLATWGYFSWRKTLLKS